MACTGDDTLARHHRLLNNSPAQLREMALISAQLCANYLTRRPEWPAQVDVRDVRTRKRDKMSVIAAAKQAYRVE